MEDNKMQAMIDRAEQDLLHTYNRYQIVLDRGEGMYLYDTETRLITTPSRHRSTRSFIPPTIFTMSPRSQRPPG